MRPGVYISLVTGKRYSNKDYSNHGTRIPKTGDNPLQLAEFYGKEDLPLDGYPYTLEFDVDVVLPNECRTTNNMIGRQPETFMCGGDLHFFTKNLCPKTGDLCGIRLYRPHSEMCKKVCKYEDNN